MVIEPPETVAQKRERQERKRYPEISHLSAEGVVETNAEVSDDGNTMTIKLEGGNTEVWKRIG